MSDNDSFNRLYEFVGAEAIGRRALELGMTDTRIFHRLSVGDDRERGRSGNPIRFVNADGGVIHSQAATRAPKTRDSDKPILRGRGYFRNGELIDEPMDFSDLNSFPLREQHLLMRDLFFPDPNGLKLAEDDRDFLQKIMGQYPRENQEVHDETIREKPDLYVKNFLRWMDPPIRDSFRCYHKSGRAYGTLTDNAYLVDREKGVSFFLAATIYVNDNGIYNDDIYEYEKTAEPFMAELAKAIYQFELQRKRK